MIGIGTAACKISILTFRSEVEYTKKVYHRDKIKVRCSEVAKRAGMMMASARHPQKARGFQNSTTPTVLVPLANRSRCNSSTCTLSTRNIYCSGGLAGRIRQGRLIWLLLPLRHPFNNRLLKGGPRVSSTFTSSVLVKMSAFLVVNVTAASGQKRPRAKRLPHSSYSCVRPQRMSS